MIARHERYRCAFLLLEIKTNNLLKISINKTFLLLDEKRGFVGRARAEDLNVKSERQFIYKSSEDLSGCNSTVIQ